MPGLTSIYDKRSITDKVFGFVSNLAMSPSRVRHRCLMASLPSVRFPKTVKPHERHNGVQNRFSYKTKL